MLESVENQAHVRLHIFPVILGAQASHPTVEQLHRLRAGLNLVTEIAADDPCQLIHQAMPDGRLPIHQTFGFNIVAGSAAFDRIARQRERRAGKPDQWHAAGERLPRQRDRIHHKTKFVPVNQAKRFNIRPCPHGIVQHRPLALIEREREAHRLERQENVRKDDRGIEGEALNGLKGDLGSQLWRLADVQDGMFEPDAPVLFHVPTCLAHKPDRCAIRRLSTAGFQKTIVHVCGHSICATVRVSIHTPHDLPHFLTRWRRLSNSPVWLFVSASASVFSETLSGTTAPKACVLCEGAYYFSRRMANGYL